MPNNVPLSAASKGAVSDSTSEATNWHRAQGNVVVPGLVRLELGRLLGPVVAFADAARMPNNPDAVLASHVLAQVAGVLGPEAVCDEKTKRVTEKEGHYGVSNAWCDERSTSTSPQIRTFATTNDSNAMLKIIDFPSSPLSPTAATQAQKF